MATVNDIEQQFIAKYNLPVMWCDYTDDDEASYMSNVLPHIMFHLKLIDSPLIQSPVSSKMSFKDLLTKK